MIEDMYQGVGYSTKEGYINVEVIQGAKPPRRMNREEREAHVAGLVLAYMYSHLQEEHTEFSAETVVLTYKQGTLSQGRSLC